MAQGQEPLHVDVAKTMSVRHSSSSADRGTFASARGSTGMPSGSVLFDGRLAQVAGFKAGVVKLRFLDGSHRGVALADYVLRARAVRPARGSGGPDLTASLPPWQPTGQRARRVRTMLDGYTTGRKVALDELRKRSLP